MLHIVEEMQNYTHAWPFLEPVSIEDVADYYDIIKDPMGKVFFFLLLMCVCVCVCIYSLSLFQIWQH